MKKNKFLVIILTVLLVSASFLFITIERNIDYSEEINISEKTVGEIYKGESKKQKIHSLRNNLSGIELIFGTYGRINDDVILFELYDLKTDKKLREKKIETKNLLDNQRYKIEFKPVKNSANKEYCFKLSSKKGRPNNSVTVYSDDKNLISYDLGYVKYSNNINSLIFPFILITVSVNLILMNSFKFKKKISIFSFILLIILFIETLFIFGKRDKDIIYPKKNLTEKSVKYTIGGLHEKKNKSKTEHIFSTDNNFTGIKVKFGTYNRLNTDKLLFKLYNSETKEEIRRSLVNTNFLEDNHEYKIEFEPIKDSKNKNYYFKIFSLNGSPENTVTLFSDSNKFILYDLGYANMEDGNFFSIAVMGILIISVLFTLYLNRENVKKEKVFLRLGLAYGLIMLLLFPPLQLPDEDTHFLRAYSILKGDFIIQKTKDNKYKSKLPSSIMSFINRSGAEKIKFKYNEKIDVRNIKGAANIPLASNDLMNFNLGGTPIINPISYVPQSFGIGIGNFLNLPVMFIFFLGRLSNFLVWLSVIYLAIKKAPEKTKNIFLILSLLPLSVQQGISYSPDALINAFSFLFLANLFKLYLNENEKFDWKYGLLLFLGIFIPTSIKVVYLLFVLLLAGLPVRKFKNRKEYVLFILLTVLVTLGVNIIWGIISPENPVSPVGQMNYLKENLFDYIGTVYLTTKEFSQYYIESSIGILGWLDTRIPYLLMYSYLGLLLICTFSDKILIKKDFKMKTAMALYLLGSYVGILTALYIAWTKPGALYVDGVQGRYFFPLFPVLLILMSRKSILIDKVKLKKNTNLFLNFGLAYLIMVLILRYYI